MSVLEKASDLIDCLGQAGEPVSLAFVRSALDMPKSSTHRLLAELAGLGIVRRTEDGRYSLGPRLLYWGEAAGETFDLRSVAEPSMRRLRDEVGESVHLYLRDERHAHVHRGRRGAPRAATVHPAGSPAPAARGRRRQAAAGLRGRRDPAARARAGPGPTRQSFPERARRRGSREQLERIRVERWADVGRRAGERRGRGRDADRRLARDRVVAALCISGPDDPARPGAPRGRCASRLEASAAEISGLLRAGLSSAGASVDRRPVELAEQLLLARSVLGDRAADPGHVHVVLEVDVLGRDVAAPRAAARGSRSSASRCRRRRRSPSTAAGGP